MSSILKIYYKNDLNNMLYNDTFIDTVFKLLNTEFYNILFVGNQQSGKTHILQGIIKYLSNKEIDILQINNFEENGLSYYKTTIATFCKTTSIFKKLLIIDDIDNLDKNCQQVLKSFIETYKHKLFVLSSATSIYKLDDSISSRLLTIRIPRINNNKLKDYITDICNKENLLLKSDAIDFMTNRTLSIKHILNNIQLFKLLDNKIITIDLIKENIAIISFNELEDYSLYCKNNDIIKAITIFEKLNNKGYTVIDILNGYLDYIKLSTVFTDEQKYEIIKLINKYILIFNTIHEDYIELIFFTNNLISKIFI